MSDLNCSKRDFLKGAALSALTAMAPMGSLQAREYDESLKWDRTTDVLVLGYGGAGACCAIEAHDKGKEVLVVEKMPRGGGNTAVPSGGFMIPDDIKVAYEYLRQTYDFAKAEMDEELLDAFCKGTGELKQFLEGLGKDVRLFVYGYAGFKNIKGAETIRRYRVAAKKGAPKKGSGEWFFDLLDGAVRERGIPVLLNTPATRLIRRGKEVVGAEIRENGKPVNVKARLGVVICTGGYEFDEESMHTFCVGTHFNGKGNPGNTGDGLRMAQSMGAKLWHMNAYSAYMAPKFPGAQTAIDPAPKGAGYIWVDQDGRRFANEKTDGHCQMYTVMYLDAVKHRYPRIPCYMIFGQETLDKGSLGSPLGSGNAVNREGLRWSRDLSAEVKMGVVKKAETIEALAAAIGVPAENLAATVQKWNADIRAGKDTLFGRPLKAKGRGTYIYDAPDLSAPIEKAPYYAVEMYPILVNTQGGPRKNVKAQMLNVYNEVVPRLYVAGELGSMWGPIYQGACNVAEALVFGRIAGVNVAGEKPLD